MKTIKAIILTGSLAGILLAATAGINLNYQKRVANLQKPDYHKGFAVVELFTSEGCSSCPPADELLAEIQKDNKNEQLYILAFHVDYWDHQGWKDRFSDREFSNRQRRYAAWLNLGTIYTPQIVVNGSAEYIGSDRGEVLRAISSGLEKPAAGSLKLNSRLAENKIFIQYESSLSGKNSELLLALVERSAQSKVRAGENSGRNLSHAQVVRQMVRLDQSDKGSISIDLPYDFQDNGWEIIGFVQNKTDGHITAASRSRFE